MRIDDLIVEFDRGLRTLAGTPRAARPMPAGKGEPPVLSPEERQEAAALMRVNHCGEICAQALYQGQALASSKRRGSGTRSARRRARRRTTSPGPSSGSRS